MPLPLSDNPLNTTSTVANGQPFRLGAEHSSIVELPLLVKWVVGSTPADGPIELCTVLASASQLMSTRP